MYTYDWLCICIPFARHHNPLLIRNRSWILTPVLYRTGILTLHKARILRKRPLEKTFLDFKKWVKSIQTVDSTAGTLIRIHLDVQGFLFLHRQVHPGSNTDGVCNDFITVIELILPYASYSLAWHHCWNSWPKNQFSSLPSFRTGSLGYKTARNNHAYSSCF